MSNEELRKNEDVVDGATEVANDGTVRRKRRRKAKRRNRIKDAIMVYTMILLMIIGAISILYVPYLYYQNKVLKTNLEYYEGIENNEATSQLLREFSNYLDSVDVSDGMSWDEFMDFEETILEYELASSINQLKESVYTEQSIIAKLEEAYQNTNDQDMQEILQVAIDSHKVFLTEKEGDLAEYNEFISQYLEMKKKLEEELKKTENQPTNTI